MKRQHSLVAISGLCFSLAAFSAQALPPVIERMPDETAFAVVLPAPETLQKNLDALTKAMEAPIPVPSLQDLLAMGGFGAGIDTKKSVGIVILPPKDPKDAAQWEEGGDQRMVFLVPVTNYAEFLNNFGIKPAGDGKVDKVSMPEGDDGFAKDIGGGYAIIGPNSDIVTAFTGKAGEVGLKSKLGKGGEDLADASDIVTIVNMDLLRPLAEDALKKMEKEAKDRFASMGEEAAKSSEQAFETGKWLGETIVRDTQILVGGVKLGEAGVSMDMLGSFKKDSYLSKSFAGTGSAGALLKNLPAGPYLWAGALDTSSAGIKTLFKDIMSRTSATMPGGEAASKAALANLERGDGQAAVMGFPVGGALAGLFTATVGYTKTKDQAAYINDFKSTLNAANGTKVQSMTYSTKFTEGGAKVGESAVDVWEMKIKQDEGAEGGAQIQQGMALLFGPQGGLGGYLAKSDSGVYMSYAKNSDIMSKALGASKGENLGGDELLLSSQKLLPKDRLAEMYVGTKSILDLALPFAAMAGASIPADKIPEKLAPIAASISTSSGSARFTIAIPVATLKTGFTLGQAVQEGMNGGGNEDDGKGDAPAGGGKPKGDTGQPKF